MLILGVEVSFAVRAEIVHDAFRDDVGAFFVLLSDILDFGRLKKTEVHFFAAFLTYHDCLTEYYLHSIKKR